MKELIRPVVFLDTICTPENELKQLTLLKIYPDDKFESRVMFFIGNIGTPFREIAEHLYKWLDHADLADYKDLLENLPLLTQEFKKLNIDYPSTSTNKIKFKRRDLSRDTRKLIKGLLNL